MPGDDAGKCHCVKIAEHGANTSRSVDGVAVREASKVGSESIFEVESHPVCFCWPTVDKEHDAECNGVQDRENNCKPDTPVPILGVRASDQATVEEEDGYFGAPAANQEGELSEPHAKHRIWAQVGLNIPNVAAAIGSFAEHDRDSSEQRGSEPGR